MGRTVGLITELEVVNSVLSVAGDQAVQSLDDAYAPVFIIKQMITNISRDMQATNFWFCTEYDVEFTSNSVTGLIILPFNILRFEPQDTRYIARGLNVYDRTLRTYEISETITADISLQLTFEELPQSARKFIQAACRIQYNNEYFGETNFKQDLNEEFTNAKNELDKENIENEDINIFNASRISNIAFKNRRR